MNETEQRTEAWNMAVYAEATRYVFYKKYRRLHRLTRSRDFLAIAVPICLAYFASADLFDFLKPYKSYAVGTLASLATLQLLVALWSLISQWDDSLADYKRSAGDNYAIKEDWKRFAKTGTDNSAVAFEFLSGQQKVIDTRDVEKAISQREKRKGMRAALIEFQRPCVCNNIPNGLRLPLMPKQKCGVCGGN